MSEFGRHFYDQWRRVNVPDWLPNANLWAKPPQFVQRFYIGLEQLEPDKYAEFCMALVFNLIINFIN